MSAFLSIALSLCMRVEYEEEQARWFSSIFNDKKRRMRKGGKKEEAKAKDKLFPPACSIAGFFLHSAIIDTDRPEEITIMHLY